MSEATGEKQKEKNEKEKGELILALLYIAGIAIELVIMWMIVNTLPLLLKFLPDWAFNYGKFVSIFGGLTIAGVLTWQLFIVIVPRGKSRVFLPFSTIVRVKGPGIRIFPLGRLVQVVDVPKEIMELEYTMLNVVSRKGTYYFEYPYFSRYLRANEAERKNLRKIIEPLLEKEKFDKELDFDRKVEIVAQKMRSGEANEEWKSIECESTTIPKISFGVYIRYPSDLEGIKKILDMWGGILAKKELEDKLSSFLEGSIREIVGRVTWMVLVANREHIERELSSALTEENSVLAQAGFPVENISVRITEVLLPRELAESLHLPQVASLRKEASVNMINGLKKQGVDVNVAAMLAEKKEPVVICINGGEGNLETLGVKIGAAFRAGMEAMRRGKAEETEEGEEKGKEKKKEKKMTEAEAMDYISTQYKKWEENHQKK
jgi:hypothetical protein